MSTKMICEVLAECESKATPREKAMVLRKNDSVPLRHILRGAFDPDIVWLLPPGAPKFKRDDSPAGLSINGLGQVTRQFYLFCNKGLRAVGPNFSPLKRESLFVQLLETVYCKDADVLIQMKDKDLKIGGLTAEIVLGAFPGLFRPPTSKVVVSSTWATTPTTDPTKSTFPTQQVEPGVSTAPVSVKRGRGRPRKVAESTEPGIPADQETIRTVGADPIAPFFPDPGFDLPNKG